MTVEEKIVSVLSGLTVYPLSVPSNGSYPCAVYQRITTTQGRHMSGNTLEKIRFQITCWGKKFSDSLATAQTVKGLLDLNTTDFMLVTKENELATIEAESGAYSTVLEFYIFQS